MVGVEAIDPFPPEDHSDLTEQFDSLPIPPLDPLFLSHSIGSAGLVDDDDQFDLDFSFDDFYMDEESGEIFPGVVGGENGADRRSPVDSKDSNSVDNSDRRRNGAVIEVSDSACVGMVIRNDEFHRVLEADSKMVKDSSESSKGQNSVDHWPKKASSEISRPVSSQGSGNDGSGAEGAEYQCKDFDRDVSSELSDCKIEVEDDDKKYMPKRKKESDDVMAESRTPKFRKSSASTRTDGSDGPEDEKRKARLIRNRESAQLSRQRKKHYVEELEDKVKTMHATITDLNGKISYFMAQNASLRQQLGGVAMCPPPPGVYPHHPMTPMGYPWMPCPPYAMNGSQTPLVPIPRLKPQQPLPAPKSKKSDSKKSESKKTEVRTKKVASISLLGLLFFLILFGALVPLINLNYGGVTGQMSSLHQDRILTVNANVIRSGSRVEGDIFKGNYNNDDIGGRYRNSYVEGKKESMSESGNSTNSGNSSLPLVASLYVPRNDKLVKIDGNLIIHSVLASEKAMASQKASATVRSKTGLAVADVAPAWAYSEAGRNRNRQPQLYRNGNARRRALADSSKASADDPQQWFREGLAGPMLSSGLCTEVFQFDMSPEANPGAVVPATSTRNTPTAHQSNSTRLSERLTRRNLRGLPNLLNITESEHMESNHTKEGIHGNKSASPMIVSVLVDPKDVSESEAEGGVMGSKSLPRIFVVVLLERVRYVTYSCVLPIKGSNPHLMTTQGSIVSS